MKRLFLGTMTSVAGAWLLATPMAKAQESVEVSAGADVVSSYIWRGQDFGSAAIQPSLSVAYKGLSLSAFGSYGLVDTGDTKELDFTLAYETGGLSVGVTDYFCLTKGATYALTPYFEYAAHKTAHVFEAYIGYDFGPASLTWYTNFAGADGLNKSGKRAYSSYVEATAPFTLGGLDMSVTAGAVPYATDFYATATGFAVTNVALTASKELKLSPTFTLPVTASIAANPSTSKCYFTIGVSF